MLHIPAETCAGTKANIRCAEKRLDESRARLDRLERKSLGQLDSQRKLLEKSMMAYTEKMRDIASNRNNELFREIQTRNATRNDTRVKSPTHSIKSNYSLPARLVPRVIQNDHYRKLKDFQQVNVFTPIEERSKESTPVSQTKPHFIRAATFCQSREMKPEVQSPKNSNRHSISCVTRIAVEPNHNDSETYTKENNSTKIHPRVVAGSIPWLKNDNYDSAYSSASEEVDYSDSASDLSDQTCISVNKKLNNKSENLLTVPVLHVRRRNRKLQRKKNILDHSSKTNLTNPQSSRITIRTNS